MHKTIPDRLKKQKGRNHFTPSRPLTRKRHLRPKPGLNTNPNDQRPSHIKERSKIRKHYGGKADKNEQMMYEEMMGKNYIKKFITNNNVTILVAEKKANQIVERVRRESSFGRHQQNNNQTGQKRELGATNRQHNARYKKRSLNSNDRLPLQARGPRGGNSHGHKKKTFGKRKLTNPKCVGRPSVDAKKSQKVNKKDKNMISKVKKRMITLDNEVKEETSRSTNDTTEILEQSAQLGSLANENTPKRESDAIQKRTSHGGNFLSQEHNVLITEDQTPFPGITNHHKIGQNAFKKKTDEESISCEVKSEDHHLEEEHDSFDDSFELLDWSDNDLLLTEEDLVDQSIPGEKFVNLSDKLTQDELKDLIHMSVNRKFDQNDYLGVDRLMTHIKIQNTETSTKDKANNLQNDENSILDGFVIMENNLDFEIDRENFLKIEDYMNIISKKKNGKLLFKQNLGLILQQVFAEGFPSEIRENIWRFLYNVQLDDAQLAKKIKAEIRTGLFLLDRIMSDSKYESFRDAKKKNLKSIVDQYFRYPEYNHSSQAPKADREISNVLESHKFDADPEWHMNLYKNLWQIEKDLHRLGIHQSLKNTRFANVYIYSIRRVLLSHVIKHPSVGYVQGMCELVRTIFFSLIHFRLPEFLQSDLESSKVLTNFENMMSGKEGVVSSIFNILFNDYRLKCFFQKDMNGINVMNDDINEMIQNEDSQLFKHINLDNVGTMSYFFSSFYTCLAHISKMEFTPHLYDLLALFGVRYQLKVLVQIITANRDQILEQDKDETLVNLIRSVGQFFGHTILGYILDNMIYFQYFIS